MSAVTVSALAPIFDELLEERRRQDAKWGEQNHPSVPQTATGYVYRADEVCGALRIPSEGFAKKVCAFRVATGTLSWSDIALEELAEAVSAPTEGMRRDELVQLGAVIVAWIQAIDRRGAK